MRIITFKRISEFSKKHAIAENALNYWYHSLTAKEINNLAELKLHFNTVDYVGNHRYVFNIKGNEFRLIAIISFNAQKVYIRFIGTHAAYDKIKDIKNI